MKKTKSIATEKPNSYKKYYYILGFLTFFIFANSIGNGYNMDDGIVTNGHKLTSQGLSAIGEIFTSNYYQDEMGYAFGYRPMVHLSFAIEHELFGDKPGAGHFINVILFALSVILFFKFILKCVGEEKLTFALITALFFAVHPIHTEVVDSLKNRDELLAFLFVIWSSLLAFKYIDKGKWISIFFTFLIFSLAMLSKKSVYPMAIITPSIIILTRNLSIKQILLIGLAFAIPGGIIGSELIPYRVALMIGSPIIFYAVIYLIKKSFLTDENKNENINDLKSSVISVLFILFILIATIYLKSIIVLLLTLPFIFWLFKVNYRIGIVAILVSLMSVDLLIMHLLELQLLILISGYGYALYEFFRTKKASNFIWIVGLLSMIYFLIFNHGLINILELLGITVFIFSLQKKSILGLIGAFIVFIIAIYISKFQLLSSLLFVVGLSNFLYEKKKNIKWIQYTAVVAFSITIGFVLYESHYLLNGQITVVKEKSQQKFVRNENILKEGRQLEFVENTLVAKHTTQEKIGTGVATLGEYFRLMSFPYELSYYYGYAKTDTFNLKNIWIWMIILVHLAMVFLAIFHLKKNPMISIGVLWYLLCIILFSNWVELVAGMVGERLAFTASAGFCIFLVGLIFWIKPDLNFKQPGIVGISTIFILTLFAGRTIVRNTDWKDTITLMGNDINHLKNSAQANNIYAMHLMAESTNNRTLSAFQIQEMQKKAIEHFNLATDVWPDYFNVYIDKARAYMVMGDYQPAIKSLEEAIKIDPNNEYSYYIIVDIYDKLGDGDSYLKYGKILFNFRQNEQTYGVLARGYFLNKDLVKSKEILLEGIKKYPNNEALKYNLNLVNQELN